MVPVPCATLNNGACMPLVGLGTASLTLDPAYVQSAIVAAIAAGYRHFDTASLYGSEAPLGSALAHAFASGIVTRQEIFVTSKLWCSDNHPDDVFPALRNSLKHAFCPARDLMFCTMLTLQLDYLDLYLIHWPLRVKKGLTFPPFEPNDFLPVDTKATWQVMEKCVQSGLTKAIGVSNFSSKKIEDMLAYAQIPPAVNQVEMHPVWQQQRLRETCAKAGIHVSAWSPLGAATTPWGSMRVLENPIVKGIADKHRKTPAQVALRWGIEHGVSVLPKSFNQERMVQNLQIFDWQLAQEDLQQIASIKQQRNVDGDFYCNLTSSPYKNVNELWDGEV